MDIDQELYRRPQTRACLTFSTESAPGTRPRTCLFYLILSEISSFDIVLSSLELRKQSCAEDGMTGLKAFFRGRIGRVREEEVFEEGTMRISALCVDA